LKEKKKHQMMGFKIKKNQMNMMILANKQLSLNHKIMLLMDKNKDSLKNWQLMPLNFKHLKTPNPLKIGIS